MIRLSAILLFFITSIFILDAQSLPQYSKTDLIVKFKSHIQFDKENCTNRNHFNHKDIDDLNKFFDLKKILLTGNRHLKNTYCLQYNHEKKISSLIEAYNQTGLFEYVEPNYIGKGHSVTPNDQFFFRQYGLLNIGNTGSSILDADIDMEMAWDIEQGDESIIVAILDTGLKMDHPEFAGRLWVNEDESSGQSDNDNNGYSADIQGWDFANGDNNPTDDHGHGTNVAGILAATGNNEIGYAGVDWNCKVMICKILSDENFGFYTWWADAIYYAVDNGAKVLNMSVGGSGFSLILREAVNYAHAKGVVIVVSMGNENTSNPYYPAAYSKTIAVGSTNNNDNRTEPFYWDNTSGSNYGDHIDVVAPGNFIYGLNYQSNTNYNTYWGGTSQAAPLVAGLSSLLLAQDPNRTPEEIRSLIRNNAEDQKGSLIEDIEGFDIYHGFGRINAFETLNNSYVKTSDSRYEHYLSIYPNPNSGRFTIDLSSDIDEVRIFNNQGELIRQLLMVKDQRKIYLNFESYPNSIYLIQAINNNNASMFVKKALIHR